MLLLGFGAIYVPKTPLVPAAIWGCRGSKSRQNPSWTPKLLTLIALKGRLLSH